MLVACPDFGAPLGGIRQIYHLADELRSGLGLDAAVLHQRAPFRCAWFSSTTPILYEDSTLITSEDLLVYPETVGAGIYGLYPGVPKVIFNQNAYYSFCATSDDRGPPEMVRPLPADVLGIICVSDDNLKVLAHAYPSVCLARLRYAIDPVLFHDRDAKQPQIVYMPRKHAEEARQIIGMLALRKALGGFTLFPLDGMAESETARILRGALIFLSFGYPEGFGLPPAEAMACGCLTLGYHGMGGSEYFTADHGWPIEAGHVLDYVHTVEAVLADWRRNPEPLRARTRAAARFIAATYSPAVYRASVAEAWRKITAGTPHAA